jgi:hypothetical protein
MVRGAGNGGKGKNRRRGIRGPGNGEGKKGMKGVLVSWCLQRRWTRLLRYSRSIVKTAGINCPEKRIRRQGGIKRWKYRR